MKDIEELSRKFNNIEKRLIGNLVKATQDTIQLMYNDVIIRTPTNTGEYASSIKIANAKIENDEISASVFTDLKSEDGHLIGRMIENGTGIYALEEHIGHTKTFVESGYKYWYVPATSVKRAIGRKINIDGTDFYVAYAQPAKPHFMPSLQANEHIFKENIAKAVKEVFKV